MEELAINIRDRIQLVDFLAEWSGFASPGTRAEAEALIRAYDEGEKTDKAELADFTKKLAREVWPVRYALQRFFGEEGALIEWDRVQQAVRRSTAHLMDRFRRNTDCHSLDEMFRHDDFEMAFREEERHEMQEVRHHLHEDYWKTHAQTLRPLFQEGEGIAKGYDERFKALKSITEGWGSLLAEDLRSVIKGYEDRAFFQGEHIPLETLDEEIAYYREQKEIPIEE